MTAEDQAKESWGGLRIEDQARALYVGFWTFLKFIFTAMVSYLRVLRKEVT